MPLVEPPVAAIPTIALRSARRSRKSRAVRPLAGSRVASSPQRSAAARAPVAVVGRDHRLAERGDSEELQRQAHRVGGEVPGAGTRPRAGGALELVEVAAVEAPGVERAELLPHVLDRGRLAAPRAGAHRAAVEHERRLVDARERHQRRGHRLVAADDADQRVEVVRDVEQLDRVGDQLARDERGAHAGRRLRLVVGDGDRVERKRHAARGLHAARDGVREVAVVEVARHRAGPRRGDADDRARQPLRVDPHRPEVRARADAVGVRRQPCARPPARAQIVARSH